MPALIWNMMMSMSGGWFFVVASEAITVGHTTLALPGIGSYIALAIEQRNLVAIGWAIGAMLVVILLYDQLLFRPLVAWADRFKFEQEPGRHALAFLGADHDAPLAPAARLARWPFGACAEQRSQPRRNLRSADAGRQPAVCKPTPQRRPVVAVILVIALVALGAVAHRRSYLIGRHRVGEALQVLRAGLHHDGRGCSC